MTLTKAQPQTRRHKVLSVLTVLNIILLCVLILAETFIGERRWYTALLTYFPQQLFVLPTLLLLLWTIFGKAWRTAGWNVLTLCVAAVTLLGVNIPLALPRAEGVHFRMMTYNIDRAIMGPQKIWDVVDRRQPDIVCLQEVDNPAFWQKLPPNWNHVADAEVALFSRFPIVSYARHPVRNSHRVLLSAVIDIHGKRVTIIDAHLSTAVRGESLSHHTGTLAAYLRQTTSIREQQIDALLRLAATSPYPVIIAGDFNTPPRGVLYRRMGRHFQDAFRVAGWGPGYSYPTRFPLMRIDYLFLDPRLHARSCWTPAEKASDHRPFFAEIDLGK